MRDSVPLIIIATLFVTIFAVEIPLTLGGRTCTAIMSSFDPIKLDIRFPSVNDLETDSFQLSIVQRMTGIVIEESLISQGKTFRKSIPLKENIIYEVCFTFKPEGIFPKDSQVYIAFSQAEDFQSLINHIEVPSQLAKEDSLKAIFGTASKLQGVSKVIASHQQRQRALEDEIVARNIHKTQRIMTLGLIECLVIILSGVYQICALRKFLIEKNLY